MIVATGYGQPEAMNAQWLGRGQRLHSSKTVSMKGPFGFRDQTGIDKISSLGAWNNPASPDRPHALAICSRLDLVRSIRGGDGFAVVQFQKRNETRIDLFDGCGNARKSIWYRLIVRCRRFWSGHERQCEMQMILTNDPDSKLAARSISKILKTGNVSQGRARTRRDIFDFFPFESFHEFLVRTDHPSTSRDHCRYFRGLRL